MVDHDTNRQTRHERILQFLERALPNKSKTERKQIAEALVRAGSKYDDYVRHKQLSKPSERRNNFEKAAYHSEELVGVLSSLDMIGKDDLKARLGQEKLEATIGHLLFLHREATELSRTVQKRGRPRDEAKGRWIREVAEGVPIGDRSTFGRQLLPDGKMKFRSRLCRSVRARARSWRSRSV